ncbi:MAG: nondiscriminating glutamyl-tRNA synthetase [Patescibacteria group bacterium]|nr:nondiscriminating glutamyl-tRNA synthetase [Patescibacteria group bacterium]
MTKEDNLKIANLLYPEIANENKPDRQKIEEKYPKRDLQENAEVMRLAPSPTGELHSGALYLAMINDILAHRNNGKLILRIEDTDKNREVTGAAERMMKYLDIYNIKIDESLLQNSEYGPYIQSERLDTYNAFVYDFLIKDYAYVCFMTSEELDLMREEQVVMKTRPGVYGKYAKSRDLTFEQIKTKIENKEPHVIRLKSSGNFDNKIKFEDELMGLMELSENDEDFIIAKTDGVPTYHFAHLIDDYLMRVTFVMRANEWIASMTKHLELWGKLGVKAPKYGHIMPINKKDGNSIRKLSKRKDPEASVAYYQKEGYTVDALKAYLMRLANPTFDDWWNLQVEESDQKRIKINLSNYEFNLDELKRNSRGPLLDFDKLNNISSDIVASMNAEEVAEKLLEWAKENDADFYNMINQNKDYLIKVLNIERETVKKRKDIYKWSMVKNSISYMYDEIFNNLNQDINNQDLLKYLKVELSKDENKNLFDNSIDIDSWILTFKNIYNASPFVNDIKFGDMMMSLRKSITSQEKTPNLYYIFEVLGRDRVLQRLDQK